MSSVHEVQWYWESWRNRGQTLRDLEHAFLVAQEFKKKRVLWVVDACHELELKGLQFIYGVEPEFHFIRDGKAVRYRADDTWQYFIYPYNPVDLQLEYTSPAPDAACS